MNKHVIVDPDGSAEPMEEAERRSASDWPVREARAGKQDHAILRAAMERLRAELSQSLARRNEAEREAGRLRAELDGIYASRTWHFARLLEQADEAEKRARDSRSAGSGRRDEDEPALLRASALLDGDWYLARYPDVAAAKFDPAQHYLLHGAAEGRDPGPNFNTRWYLATYPDVARTGGNPLVHHLLHGESEGRATAPPPADGTPAEPPAAYEPADAAAEAISFTLPANVDPAWVRQAELARRRGQATLELSGLIVGTGPAPAAGAEDAWSAFADVAPACAAFCRMMALDAGQDLRLHVGRRAGKPPKTCDRSTVPALPPILDLSGAAAGVAVADLWFTNGFDLRMRLAGTFDVAGQFRVARFFQYDHSGAGALLMVAEHALDGQGPAFLDVALLNPYLPVLLCVTTLEGRAVSASLLPFPSLCRGGVHHGELRAVSEEPGYIDGLRTVSRGLLAQLLDGASAEPSFSVARVDVDLQGASGAEPVFSPEMQEWLAVVMHVAPAPVGSSAVGHARTRAHLEASLASPLPVPGKRLARRVAARETAGSLGLILPADGVPCLHALVSRRLAVPESMRCAVGSFVVTDSATAEPAWAVTVPPMGEELLALQPAGAGLTYPVLARLPPRGGGAKTRSRGRQKTGGRRPASNEGEAQAQPANAFPLMVRMRDTRERDAASLIMPAAPDTPAPLLRRAMGEAFAREASVSILLPSCGRTPAFLAALLESARLQTLTDLQVVALAHAHCDGRAMAQEALQRCFPGRHILIDDDGGLSRSARINLAAARATGRFLLIADEDIVLHDPRTLQTLCTLADHDTVASAGCTLIRDVAGKKGRAAAFHSGGFFPSSSLLAEMPGRTFWEPDCRAVFPFATYPVAANSSALFMVRTDIWKGMGGFDATNAPGEWGAMDYGARAIAEGLVHFCTSAISAGCHADASGAAHGDGAPPIPLPAGARRNVASAASVLRALRG